MLPAGNMRHTIFARTEYLDMPAAADRATGTRRDRRNTEQNILAAFDRLVARDGIQAVGINAVAKEAGIGKVLIYRYFDGLEGLTRAWAESCSFWPDELELIGGDEAAFAALSGKEQVKTVLLNFVRSIRSRPITVEVLTSELVSSNRVTRALESATAEFGPGVGRYIRIFGEKHAREVWPMILVTYILTNYLCIREKVNPEFLGMNLNDEDDWSEIYKLIESIVDQGLSEDS